MGIDLIALVVLYCAAARAWHLGGTDKLSLPLRLRLPDPITLWLECHRCGGFWWALAVVVIYQARPLHPWLALAVDTVLVALALNWAFMASRETLAAVLAAVDRRTDALAAAARTAAERSEWS